MTPAAVVTSLRVTCVGLSILLFLFCGVCFSPGMEGRVYFQWSLLSLGNNDDQRVGRTSGGPRGVGLAAGRVVARRGGVECGEAL